MNQVPDSLFAFQRMFPDDNACAAWLIEMRWPDGFVCPACGHDKGWALRGKVHTFECAGCRRQTSVTAGTILHASKLALTVWFWAAYLMATHSNGISALQLQKQLGIGSYRSAWLLAHKLRQAMINPERQPVVGLGRDRRGQPSLPYQERSSQRRAGAQPRRQDADRRRHRTGGWNHPGPPAAGRNLLLRRCRPRPLRRNRRRSRRRRQDRRLGRLRRRSCGSPRRPYPRQDRRSSRPFLDPPGLLQPQGPGRAASTTDCAANICKPTSTSSSFASTDEKPATTPSARSSASPSKQNPLPTTC